MRKRILLSILVFTLETRLSAAVWPGDTWQTASPESQGMSSAKLAQAPSKAEIERLSETTWRARARHGSTK